MDTRQLVASSCLAAVNMVAKLFYDPNPGEVFENPEQLLKRRDKPLDAIEDPFKELPEIHKLAESSDYRTPPATPLPKHPPEETMAARSRRRVLISSSDCHPPSCYPILNSHRTRSSKTSSHKSSIISKQHSIVNRNIKPVGRAPDCEQDETPKDPSEERSFPSRTISTESSEARTVISDVQTDAIAFPSLHEKPAMNFPTSESSNSENSGKTLYSAVPRMTSNAFVPVRTCHPAANLATHFAKPTAPVEYVSFIDQLTNIFEKVEKLSLCTKGAQRDPVTGEITSVQELRT